MAEPMELSLEEAANFGVAFKAKRMPNGEGRFRVGHKPSGLTVSITSTADATEGGWQNSHRHTTGIRESYIIQEGWVVVVKLGRTGQLHWSRYEAGDTFRLNSETAHNLYVSAGTVFATVKYGSKAGREDWEAAPDLDGLVNHLSEADVLQQF